MKEFNENSFHFREIFPVEKCSTSARQISCAQMLMMTKMCSPTFKMGTDLFFLSSQNTVQQCEEMESSCCCCCWSSCNFNFESFGPFFLKTRVEPWLEAAYNILFFSISSSSKLTFFHCPDKKCPLEIRHFCPLKNESEGSVIPFDTSYLMARLSFVLPPPSLSLFFVLSKNFYS